MSKTKKTVISDYYSPDDEEDGRRMHSEKAQRRASRRLERAIKTKNLDELLLLEEAVDEEDVRLRQVEDEEYRKDLEAMDLADERRREQQEWLGSEAGKEELFWYDNQQVKQAAE